MSANVLVPGLRPSSARWSEGRKIRWFFNRRFTPWLLESVELQMREKRWYAAAYLMVLGMEILGGFLEGRAPGLETFLAFTNRYLNRIMSSRMPNPLLAHGAAPGEVSEKSQVSVAELLWASVRRGFSAMCGFYPGISIVERSHYYGRRCRRIGFRVDIHKLHHDFARACRDYTDDVCGDYLVRQRFLKRFDELCGKAKRKRGEG